MWNILICKTFTCIGISKYAKHWRLSWFRFETFITYLTFKFSTRGEIDIIFTMLTVLLTPPRASHLVDPTGLASPRFENQLASSRFKSQLTAFFQKSPKILTLSAPGMTSFTTPVTFPIRGFYYDICDCHILPTWAWTPALNVCPLPVHETE